MATQVQCEHALELFESDLSRHKNVVGLGIVPANDDQPGSSRRDFAVAVYVKKKVPADRLPAKDLVPDSLTIWDGAARSRSRPGSSNRARFDRNRCSYRSATAVEAAGPTTVPDRFAVPATRPRGMTQSQNPPGCGTAGDRRFGQAPFRLHAMIKACRVFTPLCIRKS